MSGTKVSQKQSSANILYMDENIYGENSVFDNSTGISISPEGKLMNKYLHSEGPGDHHIEVYDNWISKNAKNNVCGQKPLVFSDGRVICFEDLKIFPPRYTRDGKVLPLTPKLALENKATYGSDWHVDVVLRKGSCTGQELARTKSVCIGNVPVMTKSKYCILYNKTPRELALFGEDPNDPGGYFIVEGVEKVILLQEQLAVNKIFIMSMNTKATPEARMTVNTPSGTTLVKLVIDSVKNSIEMVIPSLNSNTKKGEKIKSINVLGLFSIFGKSDHEEIKKIISLFLKPDRVKKSLLKLIGTMADFDTKISYANMIMTMLNKPSLQPEELEKEIAAVLETDLFPHLNNLPALDNESVEERNIRVSTSKIYLLAIMIAKFLEYLAGYRALDNRDSWSNKRVEGAGRMMEQLFRNAWKKTLGYAQGAIETNNVKDFGGIVEKIRYSLITDTFRDSFITNNWGVKGMQIKNNIAQTLSRDSVVSTFAHVNTVDVKISRTDRQQNLRLVQNDQWGFICPVSTPEGENAGLLKNLSKTAKVSLERDDTPIIRMLIGDESRGLPRRVFSDWTVKDTLKEKLIINGKFLGWCNGSEVISFLISRRRSGEIYQDTSFVEEDGWVYIDVSPSRLVRPVLIVDEDQKLLIDKLGLRNKSINEIISAGAMEYISPWEQEYTKIASSPEIIEKRLRLAQETKDIYIKAVLQLEAVKRGDKVLVDEKPLLLKKAENIVENSKNDLDNLSKNKPFTHCEIAPDGFLGIVASLIPWPNHNQAPRNTYQVSMGKQALGIYHSNHANRFDGMIKTLAFPNRSIVETETYDLIGLNDRGPGENVNVAFMAFPFTEEDSFIFKKEFLDNGGFRMYKYITYSTIVKLGGDVFETLLKPEQQQGESNDRAKYIQMETPGAPVNGLPMIGAPLKQGDYIIGKMQRITSTGEAKNESAVLRVGDEGIVDKILVSTDNKTIVVTVKLRLMRVPREGDKFAPRNAQKGTIGLVLSDIDMPCTEGGLTPDIIVNTHSIPTRMTLEYPMELLAAKYAAMKGIHINASAFKPFEMNVYRQGLESYGMNEFGYEKMRSGTSGELLDAMIYNGPVFFQALKHHVKDKIQVRGLGQVNPTTRQPPKGRGNKGGLRLTLSLCGE